MLTLGFLYTGRGHQPVIILLLFLVKKVLLHGAQGAVEIFGNIFPLGAGCDTALGITLSLVVFPSADAANIFHNRFLRFLNFLFLGFVFLCGLTIPKQNQPFRDFLTKAAPCGNGVPVGWAVVQHLWESPDRAVPGDFGVSGGWVVIQHLWASPDTKHFRETL